MVIVDKSGTKGTRMVHISINRSRKSSVGRQIYIQLLVEVLDLKVHPAQLFIMAYIYDGSSSFSINQLLPKPNAVCDAQCGPNAKEVYSWCAVYVQLHVYLFRVAPKWIKSCINIGYITLRRSGWTANQATGIYLVLENDVRVIHVPHGSYTLISTMCWPTSS